MLWSGHRAVLKQIPEVESVSPVLLLLSSVKTRDQVATVFLAGFEPTAGIGGPPELVEGRTVVDDDEIVLDEAFARKLHFQVGDGVRIQDDSLRVVGISTGTNAFVVQYAFVTLKRAQALLGVPTIVTCYLVKVRPGDDIAAAGKTIKGEIPSVEVYDHQTFIENNTREMQSGFLPFVYTIAAIGVVVLTVITSLLLSINILERRTDFAILNILGAPRGFLQRLVVEHALLIAGAGIVVALVLVFPMNTVVAQLAPEVATKVSIVQMIAVIFSVAAVSLTSAFISVQRLRHIYPLEAFA